MFVMRNVPAVRKTALGDRAVLARFGLHRTVLIVIADHFQSAPSARDTRTIATHEQARSDRREKKWSRTFEF
jgi:hypothetical protein